MDLLRVIESYVQGGDVYSDFDVDGMGEATVEPAARVEMECPPIDNQGAYEMMLDLARSEAPGAVRYLESIAQLAAEDAD
ncbi:MAG TPA: hypothetical protein VNQ73_06705 [Ilumatobacter sp.]|nr:hypothetical protein [Ilumatobacter sp.]